MTKELTLEELVRESAVEALVIAELYTDTCPYCKTFGRVFDRVAEERGAMGRFVRVNVTESLAEAAEQYEIRSVPTVLILRRGQVCARSSGAVSRGALIKLLEQA